MGESVYERRYAEQGILLKHPTMYEMKQKSVLYAGRFLFYNEITRSGISPKNTR